MQQLVFAVASAASLCIVFKEAVQIGKLATEIKAGINLTFCCVCVCVWSL